MPTPRFPEHASLRAGGDDSGVRRRDGADLDSAAAAAIESLRRGDRVEDSARALHDLLHPRLRAYFGRRVRSREDVLDLTQETLLKVYSGIGGFRGESRFTAWAFAIARNVWLDWCARRPREEPADLGPEASPAGEPVAGDPDPEALADERERWALVERAIELLPRRQRQCMVLRVIHRLSYEQVATVMAISVNSVKAHLHQGRTRLEALVSGAARALPHLLAGRRERTS